MRDENSKAKLLSNPRLLPKRANKRVRTKIETRRSRSVKKGIPTKKSKAKNANDIASSSKLPKRKLILSIQSLS